MENINKNPWEGNKLLLHPLLESFIVTKWQQVKKIFFIQFIFTLLFTLGLSLLSTMKCGKHIKMDLLPFMVILMILLVEIIFFELFFIISRKQFKYNWIHYVPKLIALLIATANLAEYDSCFGYSRHVSKLWSQNLPHFYFKSFLKRHLLFFSNFFI